MIKQGMLLRQQISQSYLKQYNMELNDATVKTKYLGNSVYVSEIFGDPTTISIFVNYGERSHTPGFILRKSEIILRTNTIKALIKYIQKRQ